MKHVIVGLGIAAALPALALLSGCAAGPTTPAPPIGTSSGVRTTPFHRALAPVSAKSDGPDILVENQWSNAIHYATTVDGSCQPWIPANGAVDAGGYKMRTGEPRYECGAQISFGPAADGGGQTCILHWTGGLFLLQQGGSTHCDFSEDADGITFYYRQ